MYMNEEKEKEALLKHIGILEAEMRNLEKDLIHDSLTALKTRAFFEEEAITYLSAISAASEGKRREWFGFKNLSFLFFDIDNFKKINDTYGHAAGDTVLRDVAQMIVENLREGDTVARWGGEEMVASLLGANEEDAKNKGEQIRKRVESFVFETLPELHVTLSVGVANAQGSITCQELVNRADKALYYAKETGRNKVVAYSELPK